MSSKHVQFSVLTGLVAVFGLTVGFANANGALPGMVQSFVTLNQNGITDGAFAGAKFDIVGFISHPCYEITGTEVQSCEYSYNVTTPLKTYVENGTLLAWLDSAALLPLQATTTVTPVTVDTPAATTDNEDVSMEPTVTMTAAPKEVTVVNDSIDTLQEFDDLRTARSNKLWNICLRRDGGRDLAAICYQDNIRLLMRLDVELTEDTVR